MKKQFEMGMRGDTTKSKTRRRISSLGHGLLVLASIVGAGCAGEDETAVNDRSQDEIDLGVALEGLGTNFTACTAADSTAYVASSKTLTIPLTASKDAVLSVVNGKIKLNGWQCATAAVSGPPAVAAFDLTSTNVAKIVFSGGASTNKVVIDMLPGSFGTIFTTGGILVQGSGMSVGVRGTGLANNIKAGQEASNGPIYFELSGDSRADVKVDNTVGAISFALGDGADTFTAQGQALTTSALGGSGATVDLSAPISVFGGLGNDTIKGGLGADTLNGGEGNDWFQTSAGSTADGADLYIGGTGTDTVDYSGRTLAISASIAPTYDSGWVEGIDITATSVPANSTFTVAVNGGSATTVTFPGSATVGTTAILGVINGTASLGATAFVNDRGEIVIKTTTAAQSLTVAGSFAATLFPGLKTNNGVSALGLDPDDGFSSEHDDVQADVENLIGGTANDVLTGSIGSNTISGGAGNDDISGGPAGSDCTLDVDVLNGGDGNDIFRLGTLTNCGDAVDGGAGTDVASYELRTVGVSVTIDTTANDGEGGTEGDKILSTVEVILGSSVADTITGGAGNDEIHGGAGADFLSGGAGNDTIVGGPGADTMLGGTGEDYFNEKDVADTAFVQSILPSTIGSVESDVINGGADFDTADYGRTVTTAMNVTLCVATTNTDMGHCLDSQTPPQAIDNDDTADHDDLTNVEHFIAGAGDDVITGSTGADFIEGGDGDDLIDGAAGTDTLFGDNDDDSLVGGTGDDTLDGAAGTNSLVGGAGDDICTKGAGGTVDATCEI